MAQCQSAVQTSESYGNTASCIATTNPNYTGNVICEIVNGTNYNNCWNYSGDPPGQNPCSSAPTVDTPMDGKSLNGMGFCYNQPAPGGGTVQCAMNYSPVPGAVPTFDGNRGVWSTLTHVAPTGDMCNGDTPPPTPAGNSPTAPPAPVTDLPAVNVPAPAICGDGSCYDPNNKDFCAIGGSPCIPAASGDGPGGCNTVGDITICAGSPNAPAPPKNSVPDPATEIQSVDNYKQADPNTGGVIPVAVPVYSTGPQLSGGAGTSNPGSSTGPASSGSSGAPASSSSAGKSGSYGGGKDCITPPSCTGDAVACGASQTQWATTCQLNKDLVGDGPPSDYSALQSKYAQGDVWVQAQAGNTVGDAANNGTYDQSGFGYGTTCPMVDLEVPLVGSSFSIPFSKMCFLGGWIRGVVIGFALFFAAIITAGGRE